jgi:Tol biopolymer transport system component
VTKANALRVSSVSAAVVAALLLALMAANPIQAAFPGTNGVIAYDKAGDIWLTDSRGIDSFTVNLTNSPNASDLNPSVSPDGRHVAFESNRGTSDYEIYTLSIYTGTLGQVTNNAVSDLDPAWSPDGRKLAYVSPTDAPGRSDMDIWIKNANGTGSATNVTSTGVASSRANDLAPSWSPLGNEIAYYVSDGYDIVVKNPDTHVNRNLTTGTADEALMPNWSPDGSRIAFQRRSGPSSDYEVWTVWASDGTDGQQLTSNAFDDEYPAYSPDGTRITFSREDFGGDYDLYSVASSGTVPDERVIAGTEDQEFAPDWGAASPPVSPGCTMNGTFAADFIVGTAGDDTICAFGGNDEVRGNFGNDTISGGNGRDRLIGFIGNDMLFGDGGRDILDSRDGVNGNDVLNGGPGRDRCLKDRRELAVRSCP